jgi:cob(I)alamin adenosyltransferase
MSLTVLYGQTGSKDTLTCYTNTELKKIATKVVYANECDTLVSLINQQLALKDSVIQRLDSTITIKNSMINSQDSVILLKDTIINVKNDDMDLMMHEIKKVNQKLKWAKVGWVSSVTGLFVLLVMSIVK